MNPKLDQLRKRYANPSAQPDASGAYALGPRSITADHAEEQPTINDTNPPTLTSPGELGPSFGAFDPSGGDQLKKNFQMSIAPDRFDDRTC